jgi:hypothetical protein
METVENAILALKEQQNQNIPPEIELFHYSDIPEERLLFCFDLLKSNMCEM